MSDFGHVGTFRAVACWFYQRIAVDDHWVYQQIDLCHGPEHAVRTTTPPVVGDLVHFDAGTFRVVERAWSYPQYGSTAFPANMPPDDPMLYIIVEEAIGPFRNEILPEDGGVGEDGG